MIIFVSRLLNGEGPDLEVSLSLGQCLLAADQRCPSETLQLGPGSLQYPHSGVPLGASLHLQPVEPDQVSSLH